MENKGFLGTIGYIKANLMTSSALADKDYNNENFYPGAPNIPESDAKLQFPYKIVGSPTIDSDFNASGFSANDYILIGDVEAFTRDYDIQLTFTTPSKIASGTTTTIQHPILSSQGSDTDVGYCFYLSGRRSTVNPASLYWNGYGMGGGGFSSYQVNTKYSFLIKRRFEYDPAYNKDYLRMYLTITNVNTGTVLYDNIEYGQLLSNASAQHTGVQNVSNHILGYSSGLYPYTGFSGIIHLKECYFKAL